jgi:hypothetical protein
MATLYSPRIVTDGLVLYLDAGNRKSYPGSGTSWTDLTGNGNNGTLINGPSFNSGNGGSISFDGVNDRWESTESIPSINFQYTSQFTVSAWCYINENTGTGYIASYRLTDGNGTLFSGWGVAQDAGKLVGIVGGFPSSVFSWRRVETTTTTFSNLVYQKWANVVYVNTGVANEQKIYVAGINATNSTLDNSTPPYTVNYTTSFRLRIGHDLDSNHPLNGNIAQVSMYNRALTALEVTQNYNATRSRFGV